MYTIGPRPNMAPNAALALSDQHDCSSEQHGYHFAVRIGLHGQVGRFAGEHSHYRRGSKVLCRTERGVEVGVVLNSLPVDSRRDINRPGSYQQDGLILRAMAPEDHLLWNHLLALAEQAYDKCQQWLQTNALSDQLLEVEPLMDGRTLYFHFLNHVSPATSQHVDQLANIFQQTVAASSFASLLETGCGPGCGTEKASKCGSGCATCKIACHKR